MPNFSPVAVHYARARPRYPDALFSYLASLVESRRLAWDCATGNGQATLGLAQHFERVVATDVSAEQLEHAVPHPRIEYRLAPAERSGLDDACGDLVTVGAAAHWFDLPAFLSEVRRVLRPNGLLAVWTYHVAHIEPPFRDVLWRLYEEHLFADFAPGARLVDHRYETLDLPNPITPAQRFEATASWTLDQIIEFILSWSGSHAFMRRTSVNPVDLIRGELERIWGPRDRVHALRWPIYLKLSRF
jgi:SAM-dependent methyltransferase